MVDTVVVVHYDKTCSQDNFACCQMFSWNCLGRWSYSNSNLCN